MDIRNPTAAELTDIVSRISLAFGYKAGEGSVAEDFPQLYQASNSKNLWIASEESVLRAHAGFYPAVLRLEGSALPVAAIGGVYTEDQSQGKGLASQLVNRCAEEAKRGGAALVFLWSDKHDFYRKLGFHLLARQWTLTLDPQHASALRAKGKACGIPAQALRFSEGEITPEFLAQSLALLEEQALGPARTVEEHALYLGGGSCRVIAAWAGPQLAAYFVIGKGKDLHGYVHEWAGVEGALHHLAAHCLESSETPLAVISPQFMPDEVQWIYSLDAIGVPFRPEFLALVRLLDFEKVCKGLAVFMANVGLPPSDLRLQQEGEEYLLQWKGEAPLRLNEEQFLRLLFGPELPAHQELRTFLPMRLWYWGMDSV